MSHAQNNKNVYLEGKQGQFWFHVDFKACADVKEILAYLRTFIHVSF